MFCHVKDNVYLCNAKIKVRYEDAATEGGICCIYTGRNPIGAVTASVSRKAPVALHFKP